MKKQIYKKIVSFISSAKILKRQKMNDRDTCNGIRAPP